MWLAEYFLIGAVLWWVVVLWVTLSWSKRVWSWEWGREVLLATVIFAGGGWALLDLVRMGDQSIGVPFGYISWLGIVALAAGGVLYRATQSWLPAIGVAIGSSLAMAATSYQPNVAVAAWMLPTSAALFIWSSKHRIHQLARFSRLHQRCAHCQYHLDGVFVDSCPECGKEIPPGVVAGVFNGIGLPPDADLVDPDSADEIGSLQPAIATDVAASARAKATAFAGAAASRSGS